MSVNNRSHTQRTVKIPIEMSTGLTFVTVKVKGKVNPRRGHEGPDRE